MALTVTATRLRQSRPRSLRRLRSPSLNRPKLLNLPRLPSAKAPAAAAPAEAAYDLKAFDVEPNAKIVFSGWGDETEQKIYRDSIARFNKVYPGVTVDFQPIPADFQTKVKALMAGGTAPDVMYIDDQLMTAFGASGQLLALDDYMAQAGAKRDDFIPPLLTIFTMDGKTYGLPKDWGTLGLVYLPEAFTEAGIAEPTASWTWDDLKNGR